MQLDRSYLHDIVMSCELILEFIADINFEQFENDFMRQDAIIRRIEIIGEATRNLSDSFKDSNKEIPWHQIRGMRNRLVHNYDEINLELVWTTCRNDIPDLLEKIQFILDEE